MKLTTLLPSFLLGTTKRTKELLKGDIIAVPSLNYYRIGEKQHADSGHGYAVSWIEASPVEPKRFEPIQGESVSIWTSPTFDDDHFVVRPNPDDVEIQNQKRNDQLNQDIKDGKLLEKDFPDALVEWVKRYHTKD